MGGRIVVHSLDQARAALAAASALRRNVVLASAPGAGCYAGPAWFKSLVEQAKSTYPGAETEAVLDCGADSGVAKAAMRRTRSICATGKTPKPGAALISRAGDWPDATRSAISGLKQGKRHGA